MSTVENQILVGKKFDSHPSWLDTGGVGHGYCLDTPGGCCFEIDISQHSPVLPFPFVVRVYHVNL
jgi:hypothetical protein